MLSFGFNVSGFGCVISDLKFWVTDFGCSPGEYVKLRIHGLGVRVCSLGY